MNADSIETGAGEESNRRSKPVFATRFLKLSAGLLAAVLSLPGASLAQSSQAIYSDSLASGWQDASYLTIVNFTNGAPVHSGSDSISVTVTQAFRAFKLKHAPMSTVGYAGLSFWLNGGNTGGQQLQMYGALGANYSVPTNRCALVPPPVNTWQQYFVPLSALGVDNTNNFSLFAIQDALGYPQPAFYVDDIELVTAAPAGIHVTVNAGQSIRTADARWFGMNTVVWGSALRTPSTLTNLNDLGSRALRFPGGSDSDTYHWLINREDGATGPRPNSLANFINVVTNCNAQAMITLNYGSGSTNEAAAWVAYVNATTNNSTPLGLDANGFNWQTAGYWASLRAAAPLGTDDGRNFLRLSRAAPLGFKYWELGNEVYGSWESDSNTPPHDPYTYALRARAFISLIKAVDPAAKVGVVAVPGDNQFVNYTNHPALNLRTGVLTNGWTPVVLATLRSLGAIPDFLIHHNYPEGAGSESDAQLLQSSVLSPGSPSSWSATAAVLRWELSDYFGAGGTNIELVCTENNSVASKPGKQTTSLVNALFLADGLGAMMQTEFNGLFWWDLSNGDLSTNGNVSSSLYGWRLYGDYGVFEGTTNFPTYYMLKLLKNFVQPGDTVISAVSDSRLLSAYAARRQDGSLTILAINKDPANTADVQLNLTGFVPASAGVCYSYGISQDQAAEFGANSADIAQTVLSGAGPNLSCAFPPYSASVLSLSPAPATLQVTGHPGKGTPFVFQLQGQAGVPYVIESSTDLFSWTPVSTNTLVGSTLNITNPVSTAVPRKFWRAVWQP